MITQWWHCVWLWFIVHDNDSLYIHFLFRIQTCLHFLLAQDKEHVIVCQELTHLIISQFFHYNIIWWDAFPPTGLRVSNNDNILCLQFFIVITWIPWNLSFRYILFHEKRAQTMLWHHNARVNSHQRWNQTRFRVCFHL